MVTACAYAEAALLNGTTTIVCDSHEIGNVLDRDGIAWMLEDAREAPLNIYLTVPSTVPATSPDLETAGGDLDAGKVAALFDAWPEAVGLGEKMDFVAVLSGRSPRARHHSGGPRARTPGLGPYLRSRLRGGLRGERRHRHARGDRPRHCRRPPGGGPVDLPARRAADDALAQPAEGDRDNPRLRCRGQARLRLHRRPRRRGSPRLRPGLGGARGGPRGIPRERAWSMGSLHPATRYGLDGEIGGFGGGRRADLVLLDDDLVPQSTCTAVPSWWRIGWSRSRWKRPCRGPTAIRRPPTPRFTCRAPCRPDPSLAVRSLPGQRDPHHAAGHRTDPRSGRPRSRSGLGHDAVRQRSLLRLRDRTARPSGQRRPWPAAGLRAEARSGGEQRRPRFAQRHRGGPEPGRHARRPRRPGGDPGRCLRRGGRCRGRPGAAAGGGPSLRQARRRGGRGGPPSSRTPGRGRAARSPIWASTSSRSRSSPRSASPTRASYSCPTCGSCRCSSRPDGNGGTITGRPRYRAGLNSLSILPSSDQPVCRDRRAGCFFGLGPPAS